MEQARRLALSAYDATFRALLSLVERDLVPGQAQITPVILLVGFGKHRKASLYSDLNVCGADFVIRAGIRQLLAGRLAKVRTNITDDIQ